MPGGQQYDGFKAANEVTDAMMGVPWYADDSMFFTIRYSDKAKTAMRRKDWDEFMTVCQSMGRMWDNKTAEASGGVEERARKTKELRERALELVKPFPELERDFDRFLACSKAAAKSILGGQ